jgi:hypothetical protein
MVFELRFVVSERPAKARRSMPSQLTFGHRPAASDELIFTVWRKVAPESIV